MQHRDLLPVALLLLWGYSPVCAGTAALPAIDCRDQHGQVTIAASDFRQAGPTLRPMLVKRVLPQAPKDQVVQGINIFELAIDTSGNVCNARLLKGDSASLGQLWLATVRQWKFEPPKENGKPVAVRMTVTASFDPLMR
jgi:TonB family protein